MDASAVARYRIQGVDVVVRSNDPAILARVRDTYGWFEVDADLPFDDGAAAVEVALIRAADGTTTVVDAEGREDRWRDEDQPLVGLFDAIVAGSIAALSARGILAIHSGVVAIDGRAILIAGRSGRGKTTLVLGLLRRGLDLLSDELALVAADDRTVLAYPRGLHIRPAALDLFPELGFLADVPAHELGGGSEWAVGPEDLARAFGTPLVAAARIGAIVLLDDDPAADEAPELSVVPGAIATMELLRAPLGGLGLRRSPGSPAADRRRRTGCRLRSGRLEETVDAILTWVSRGTGSGR